jgi:hypothetical protein
MDNVFLHFSPLSTNKLHIPLFRLIYLICICNGTQTSYDIYLIAISVRILCPAPEYKVLMEEPLGISPQKGRPSCRTLLLSYFPNINGRDQPMSYGISCVYITLSPAHISFLYLETTCCIPLLFVSMRMIYYSASHSRVAPENVGL